MVIPAKMAQVIAGLLEIGTPFLCLEVRGMKPETVNYTSKVDGKKASFAFYDIATETIGENSKQMKVSMDLPKGATIQADGRVLDEKGNPIPNPFKKGDKVIVTVRGIAVDKGVTKIQAQQLEPWADK